MGRRGPRPQPTKLKLLRGNPGRRRLNAREPQPEAVAPDAPEQLNEEARREWARVVGELEANGLITRLDRAALAGYCMAWSHWIDAEVKLREFGAVLKSPTKGFPILSPYWTIANTALKQMRDLLSEFGMSPASRTRVEAVDRTPEADTLTAFLAERPKVPRP
jgi:P27 family predicted phage terminase small subunit